MNSCLLMEDVKEWYIDVPGSTASILNMTNVKTFLETGKIVVTHKEGKREESVKMTRNGKTYVCIDSVDRLSDKQW